MPPTSSRSWRWIALLAIAANVVFNQLAARGWPFGRDMADLTAKYDNLFVPAGYAFAIWGLIYAAFVAYAIWALLPSQREVRAHDRVAPALAVTNALASAWIVAFMSEWLPLSVLIIALMLALGIVMFRTAATELRGWPMVPFSLFLGWIAVATIANVAILGVSLGWRGEPFPEPAVAITMLIVAGAVAALVAWTARDPVVPAVVTWAALAIWAAQHRDSAQVGAAALAVAVGCGVFALGAGARRLVR